MKTKKITAKPAAKPVGWYLVVTREGTALSVWRHRASAQASAKLARRCAGFARVVRVQAGS